MVVAIHILANGKDIGDLVYVVAVLLFAGVSALSKWLQGRSQEAERQRRTPQKTIQPAAKPIPPLREQENVPTLQRPRIPVPRPEQAQPATPRRRERANQPLKKPAPGKPTTAEARTAFETIAKRRSERETIARSIRQVAVPTQPSGAQPNQGVSTLSSTLKTGFDHLPEHIRRLLAEVAARENRTAQELYAHLSAGRSEPALIEAVQHLATQVHRPAITAIALRHLPRHELQRAFVMSEVFSPPLALREMPQG